MDFQNNSEPLPLARKGKGFFAFRAITHGIFKVILTGLFITLAFISGFAASTVAQVYIGGNH